MIKNSIQSWDGHSRKEIEEYIKRRLESAASEVAERFNELLKDAPQSLDTLKEIADKIDTLYTKPETGIPATDLAEGVIPTISTDITTDGDSDTKTASPKAVKTYVDESIPAALSAIESEIETIGRGEYVTAWGGASTPVVADIPAGVSVTYNTTSYTGELAASDSTMGKIYLVSTGTTDEYDRYVTVRSGSVDSYTYSWSSIGSTSIQLSDYATRAEVSQLGQEVNGIPPVTKSGVIPVKTGQVNQRSSGAKCVIDIPAGTYLFQMDGSFFNGLCRIYAMINGSGTHIGDLANINGKSVTLSDDATEIYIYCAATIVTKTGDCSFSLSQEGVRGIKDDITDLDVKTEKIDGVSKDASVSFTLTAAAQSSSGTKKDVTIKKGKYWVDVSPMSLLTASNVYVYAYYASAPATSVLIGYLSTNMLNYWVLSGNTYLHEIQFSEDVVALSIYHANNATGAGDITLSFVDQEAVPSFEATIAQLTKKTSPVFSAFSDSGDIEVSGGALALPKVHITKNSALSLEIDGTIENVAFGIGYSSTAGNKRGYTGYWCVLKPSILELYYSDNSTVLIDTIQHGLTLDDKTKVSIRVMDNVGDRKIRITTKAGAVYENIANINFYGVGSPFVENNNTSAQISAKIAFIPCDISKRVWVFGDSYCGTNNPARWMTQILEMGIGGFLLNAKGGEAMAEAVSDLDNVLSIGYIPTYILWCLGMNGTADGDASTVSDYQKLWLMRFLRRCTQNGITPVLCTIPTVPSLQHNAYNAYIKTLGYRIVDMADAVGAQADGTWYPGLISSDNVHPSEEGARVLAMRVLRDFPEIQLL